MYTYITVGDHYCDVCAIHEHIQPTDISISLQCDKYGFLSIFNFHWLKNVIYELRQKWIELEFVDRLPVGSLNETIWMEHSP